MNTRRLTAAQATVRYLAAQLVNDGPQTVPYFVSFWAIFGHVKFPAANRLPKRGQPNEQKLTRQRKS